MKELKAISVTTRAARAVADKVSSATRGARDAADKVSSATRSVRDAAAAADNNASSKPTDWDWGWYISEKEKKTKEINKMTDTNNIMIPRFITLTPVDEQFEARFNAMHIIDYASNGKNCVVHVLQGSVIKTIVVEESVQDIMKLIGDE